MAGNMKKLSEITKGMEGTILEISEASECAGRLMSFGLLPGVRVKLIQVAPLGDPITIEFSGQRISLRRADASCVTVENS